MDISTIGGFVFGIICIVVSIILAGGGRFIDMPSVFVTIGGTVASVFISYPASTIVSSFKTIKFAIRQRKLESTAIIQKIIDLANIARKEGLLALEEAANNLDDKFLKKGILLIVDGTDPELVRSILETELAFIEGRHKDNHSFFETIASLGPAWGMIGTLIGLIAMLGSLSDPSTLGPKMAVALITTFYGSVIANFFATPVATKLKGKTADEILLKEVMIEGLLSIQAGENPRIIEEKLKAFLAPSLRESIGKKDEAGE